MVIIEMEGDNEVRFDEDWSDRVEGFVTSTNLKSLFSRVHELVSLEFGTFHKCLAALCTHMHTWSMCVKVLSHGGVVFKHLAAPL